MCIQSYKKPIPDNECINLIEKKIGEGTRRTVYSVKNDPDVVIKEMKSIFPGSNMYEHFVWNLVKNTRLCNNFGECITISESGKYLIMEYLSDLDKTDHQNIPTEPSWCTDKKPDNFGKSSGGIIKYRDYDLLKHDEIGTLLANGKNNYSIFE